MKGGVGSAALRYRASGAICFASTHTTLWMPPCLGMKPGLLTIRVR